MSNTPLKIQKPWELSLKNPMLTCRLDYLSFTVAFSRLRQLEDFIDTVSGFVVGGERWAYLSAPPKATIKSVGGLLAWLSYRDEVYRLRVELSGQFCQVIDQLMLCRFLDSESVNITRLDIALDDYERRVSFSEVKAAGDKGHYRLVDSFKAVESAIAQGADIQGTAYFGKGDKILRFYDAQFMHDIAADRWELQLRGDLASTAFTVYLESPDCLPSLVVGAVDFGVSGSHYRDFSRFDWWQSLIDVAGFSYKLKPNDYKPDLSRTIRWLDNSVAPSLAVLRSALGSEFGLFMDSLCVSGSQRLKPYHQSWIQTIKEFNLKAADLLTIKE